MLHGIQLVTKPSSDNQGSKFSGRANKTFRGQQCVVKMIFILFCYGWQPRERSERSSRKTRSATSVCGRFLSRHELFYKSYNMNIWSRISIQTWKKSNRDIFFLSENFRIKNYRKKTSSLKSSNLQVFRLTPPELGDRSNQSCVLHSVHGVHTKMWGFVGYS